MTFEEPITERCRFCKELACDCECNANRDYINWRQGTRQGTEGLSAEVSKESIAAWTSCCSQDCSEGLGGVNARRNRVIGVVDSGKGRRAKSY